VPSASVRHAASRAATAASPRWLDLPPHWLFDHLPDAILLVDLASARVRLANPAAARLFGYAPAGEPIGQLVPGLVDAPAWQHLVRDHPAGDARVWLAPATGLSVSLSCLDARYALVVVRQPAEQDPHPNSVAPDEPLGSVLAIQSFLDHATRALTSSLDYDTTLQTAARLAVPRLGDACLVDVLGEGQVIERAAAAHVDLADEARLFDLADSYPRESSQQEPAFQGVLDATPRRVDDVSSWSSVAPDQAHADVLDGLSLHSALLVPLVVRGLPGPGAGTPVWAGHRQRPPVLQRPAGHRRARPVRVDRRARAAGTPQPSQEPRGGAAASVRGPAR
jgi:PAS domain